MAVLIKRSVKIINVSAAVNGDGPYHICYALDGSLYVTNIRGPVWNVYDIRVYIVDTIPTLTMVLFCTGFSVCGKSN